LFQQVRERLGADSFQQHAHPRHWLAVGDEPEGERVLRRHRPRFVGGQAHGRAVLGLIEGGEDLAADPEIRVPMVGAFGRSSQSGDLPPNVVRIHLRTRPIDARPRSPTLGWG
jgi:hypothetical protein